jgi:hypothetical protein
MGSTCVSGGAVHSRARTRQVTRFVPNQIGRLPEEFLWLVLTSRGCPRTPSRPKPAGVPNRLLAGVDALTGRARLLAERFVDGLALFEPRGPRFLSLWPREGGGSPRSVAGAVRCGRQNDVMKLSSSTSDSSSVKRKP